MPKNNAIPALIVSVLLGSALVPSLPAQTTAPQQGSGVRSMEKPLAFDAASIKPYNNSGGGGGRNEAAAARPPAPGGDPAGSPPGRGAGGGPPGGGGGVRFTPGRVASSPRGVTTRKLILEAYHLNQYQLAGGPGWLDSDWFSVNAEAGTSADESQLRLMLQTLLAERFKLAVHRETREMPVYSLVVGKNGSKLREWKEGDPVPPFGSHQSFRDIGTMQRLADVLSSGPDVGRPVLDKTGLKGSYLFYVEWDDDGDFVTAMQDQLGLKLASEKGPVDTLVIDHIEKLAGN